MLIVMLGRFFLLFLWVFLSVNVAIAGDYYDISNSDKAYLNKALSFVYDKKYDLARIEAAKASDKDVLKLILWLQYQSAYDGNNYKDIASFMQANSNWPRMKLMRNRAELALTNDIPADTVIKYFEDVEPITGHAMRILAEAKIEKMADDDIVNNLLRQSWVQGDFILDDERSFLKQHSKRLRHIDHVKRVERLLWEKKISAAKRIIGKVNSEYKRLFRARIALIQRNRGVDYALSRVDESLKGDPGLLYDRINWHKKRRNYHRIYDFLLDVKATMPYQEKWWKVKNRLIRELVEEKKYNRAYNIAANHGNEAGSGGYAEAEWLAGWIALDHMDNRHAAYEHFYNMYENVNFPVSKSRAAYWAGRAAEENNNHDIARGWYKLSAKHPTTFYGQMAHIKVYGDRRLKLPKFPKPSYTSRANHRNNILAKMAYILAQVNERRKAEWFIISAIKNNETPAEMGLISRIGKEIDKKQYSVIAAKRSLRKGVILSDTGWPVLDNIPDSEAEKALVLGIIRQESRFDKDARSHANAMGLMQLIPSTAKRTSRQLRLKYGRSKLTKDPEYNMQLGSHYISGLINKFDGSYILAIASYNAGPTNVKRWIRTYGDPRKMKNVEEVINWIEHVPFKETRNYIQRVLENTQIYRHILNGRALALDHDLIRVNTRISSN